MEYLTFWFNYQDMLHPRSQPLTPPPSPSPDTIVVHRTRTPRDSTWTPTLTREPAGNLSAPVNAPAEFYSPMLMNAPEPLPRINRDQEDTIPRLESWLTTRCPTLDIQQLISTYNRVEIPWMEDHGLLLRLKTTVERSHDDPEEVVMRVLQDLVKERTESDARCEDEDEDEPDTNFYRRVIMPPSLYAIWLSLRRGKSMLTLNDAVDRLIPHLFDKIDAELLHHGRTLRHQRPESPQPIKKPGRRHVKRTAKPPGVAKSTVLVTTTSPTSKSRRGDGTESAPRLRKSPRFHKADPDRHGTTPPVSSNPSYVDVSVGDDVIQSIEIDEVVQ